MRVFQGIFACLGNISKIKVFLGIYKILYFVIFSMLNDSLGILKRRLSIPVNSTCLSGNTVYRKILYTCQYPLYRIIFIYLKKQSNLVSLFVSKELKK